MLRQLCISNYALIERLDVEFRGRFTAITGETGSGKSIVVDALGLALGERARSSRVRKGATRAEVSAEFEANAAAQAWLAARELRDEDDPNRCVLRRTLASDGRSRGFVNGRPAPLSDLRELGSLLIDVHAQHDHTSLLKADVQRRLLDEFGVDPAVLRTVASAWRALRDLRARASGAGERREELSARLQLLGYQHEELAELAPEEGEFERLYAEQKRLEHADELIAMASGAYERVLGDGAGLRDVLTAIERDIERANDPALDGARELLEAARINAEEAAAELGRYADAIDSDPARLAVVEARLRALWDTARRQRCEPDELPARMRSVGEEITHLRAELDALEGLAEAESEAYAAWQSAARDLSAQRERAAGEFAAAIVAEMQALSMPDAHFEVRFEPAEGEHGAERVCWLISTNAGVAPGPLAEVASGGELSRVSLAIQIVASRSSSIPSLVLDEADVGIGGATADAVGRLLRRLGEHTQILSVTHQPQVAACAHDHMRVDKADGIRMTLLDDTGRAEELARMVGGRELTHETRAHAADMLARGQTV